MSWQTYVDQNLVGTQKVSRAAILGQKGGVWATSPGYSLSPAEQTGLLNSFKDINVTQSNGLKAAGRKFFTIYTNERSIYGKNQADGILVVKTKQAILVAEYIAPLQAGEATPVVEGLADYLISQGY